MTICPCSFAKLISFLGQEVTYAGGGGGEKVMKPTVLNGFEFHVLFVSL